MTGQANFFSLSSLPPLFTSDFRHYFRGKNREGRERSFRNKMKQIGEGRRRKSVGKEARKFYESRRTEMNVTISRNLLVDFL